MRLSPNSLFNVALVEACNIFCLTYTQVNELRLFTTTELIKPMKYLDKTTERAIQKLQYENDYPIEREYNKAGMGPVKEE